MVDFSQFNTIPLLGMYAMPYATAYPDLVGLLSKLYRDKLSGIPWLPPGWWATLSQYHGVDGNVMVPAPSGPTLLRPGAIGVPWLDNDAKRAWWDQFNRDANSIIGQYAAGQQAQGAAALNALYAKADFWNSAYDLAQFVAAPVTVTATVAKAAVDAGAAVGRGVQAVNTAVSTLSAGSKLAGFVGIGVAALLVLWLIRRRSA